MSSITYPSIILTSEEDYYRLQVEDKKYLVKATNKGWGLFYTSPDNLNYFLGVGDILEEIIGAAVKHSTRVNNYGY